VFTGLGFSTCQDLWLSGTSTGAVKRNSAKLSIQVDDLFAAFSPRGLHYFPSSSATYLRSRHLQNRTSSEKA